MFTAHDTLADKIIKAMEARGIMEPNENEPEEYGELFSEFLVSIQPTSQAV